LREQLNIFGLENYLSDIVFVTDRGANFVKGLHGYSVLFCTAHRLNNVLKLTFYQNPSKGKKNNQGKTTPTTTVVERTEVTPDKVTTIKTKIEASPEIDTDINMVDYDHDSETDASDNDDETDYSSITISDLPRSAKEVLDTIRDCKALVRYTKKVK
jgi:hypothetical protein